MSTMYNLKQLFKFIIPITLVFALVFGFDQTVFAMESTDDIAADAAGVMMLEAKDVSIEKNKGVAADNDSTVIDNELYSDTNVDHQLPAKKLYASVPLYNQCDYPDTPYSQGSVATSGCGITCLAMVGSYILQEPLMPDELGAKYNGAADSNDKRMEAGANDLGLSYHKVFTWSEVVNALNNGDLAIVLVNQNSIFTNYGHFIVVTGITEDGKFLVNDPYGPNYKRLAYGFEDGFEEWQMTNGFSGAWIFDAIDETESITASEMMEIKE